MITLVQKVENVIGPGRIRVAEPLSEHTVKKTGGLAEFYIEVDKTDDLIRSVREARKLEMPVLVFGTGAHMSFPDEGLQGLVIKNSCRRFDKASVLDANALVSSESGVNLNQLVRFTIEEGFEGLEYQLGMPGTVGGAMYTNAKYEPKNILVRSHLYSIRILDTDGEVQTYTEELPDFVPIDDELETKEVILSVVFKLMPFDKKILWERGEEAVAYRSKK
jgi:UDP-N-acetylenolpyruvoylglucosamine reductase